MSADGHSYSTKAEAQDASRQLVNLSKKVKESAQGDSTAGLVNARTAPIFPWLNKETLQPLITVIVALAVFCGSWIYTVTSWGWFLGLSLGWIPSAMFAALAGWFAFYAWLFVLAGSMVLGSLIIYALNIR